MIGGSVSVLVGGKSIANVSSKAAAVTGVTSVLAIELDTAVAENVALAYSNIVTKYTHILAPCSNNGKNYFPRLAATLDASPLSDVLEVIGVDTFKRPMYAGNAIATVKVKLQNIDYITFFLMHTYPRFNSLADDGSY